MSLTDEIMNDIQEVLKMKTRWTIDLDDGSDDFDLNITYEDVSNNLFMSLFEMSLDKLKLQGTMPQVNHFEARHPAQIQIVQRAVSGVLKDVTKEVAKDGIILRTLYVMSPIKFHKINHKFWKIEIKVTGIYEDTR